MTEGPSRPISPEASGDQGVPSRARGVGAVRRRKQELERRSSAPSVSAKKKEVGKLPTRIEDEPEEFWKSLTPGEKRAVMTRHRSAAQLKRHGAEVTEEGRLKVTEKQIGRARKEMEKERRKRREEEEQWEAFLGRLGGETLPVEETPGEEEEVAEGAEVAEVETEGKPDWRERLRGAVGRFVEGVNGVFEQWAPKVEELAEKAKALGAVAKWSVVTLVDGPLWLIREWRLAAKEKEIKKYKGEIKRDEEVYGEIKEALEGDVEQRIKVAEESLIAQLRVLKGDTDTAGREIKEEYAIKARNSNSGVEGQLREHELEAELHAMEVRRSARVRRLQAEVYRHEAEILEEYDRTLESYLTRYVASVDRLAGRVHSAVEARDKWGARAEKSREKERRLNAALEELSR